MRTVFAAVLGATEGLSVYRFGSDGPKRVMWAQIPWAKDGDAILWPMEWLKHVLGALRALPGPEGILTMAMWGADIAKIKSWDDATPTLSRQPRFYQSVPAGTLEEVTAVVPAKEIYRATGGANVAKFQPYCQLWADHGPSDSGMLEINEVIPLADLMTGILTGFSGKELCCDPIMRQSQGLAERNCRTVYTQLFGQVMAEKIGVRQVYRENIILRAPGNVLITPVTHDSVFARLVAFACCPWAIWSGTWMGTATSLEGQPRVQPTGETFKAGVAFEGVGDSRTAITNIAMLGKVWKQLFKAYLGQEATYEQAAKEALICLKDNMERFDLSKLPEDSAEVVAFMDEVCGKGASNSFKLACFINSCAAACDQKLKATAEVLHLSRPTVVAIIGGWAENVAFRRALEMLGYKVQIPPLATLATHAGLAADALVRVGYAPSFAQALAMMISKA